MNLTWAFSFLTLMAAAAGCKKTSSAGVVKGEDDYLSKTRTSENSWFIECMPGRYHGGQIAVVLTPDEAKSDDVCAESGPLEPTDAQKRFAADLRVSALEAPAKVAPAKTKEVRRKEFLETCKTRPSNTRFDQCVDLGEHDSYTIIGPSGYSMTCAECAEALEEMPKIGAALARFKDSHGVSVTLMVSPDEKWGFYDPNLMIVKIPSLRADAIAKIFDAEVKRDLR